MALGLEWGVLAAGTHEAVPVDGLFFLVCCCFSGLLEAGSGSLNNVLSAAVLFFLSESFFIVLTLLRSGSSLKSLRAGATEGMTVLIDISPCLLKKTHTS